jgi:hypothetical protein
VADDSRSGTPSRQAPFERGETLGRWKESLEAPVSGIFGGQRQKSEKGRKKGEAFSNIRRMKTWKAPKLKRAEATLASEKEDEG